MNGYTLSRAWFDFAFENASIVKPVHGAVYFWAIELSNRMGWPKEFANPASQCMQACGISSYNTYKKAFQDLQQFGFIKVVKPSLNQWQACIIALSNFDKAPYEALDKAVSDHCIKHSSSTRQSTDSIIKPQTNKPKTKKPKTDKPISDSYFDVVKEQYEKLGEDKKELWDSFLKFYSKDETLVQIRKLEQQPTPNQIIELESRYGVDAIVETLHEMANWKKITTKVSVYLTLQNWLKRNN